MMIGDAELALPHYDSWAADALQVLDEEGIPVVSAISRTSSGCILDAPGAVQVRLHVHLDLKFGRQLAHSMKHQPPPHAAAALARGLH